MRRVVVVAPTYNEEENVEKLIKEVLAQQKFSDNFEIHILISDSHSPDKTIEIAEKIALGNDRVHVIDVVERGIGVGIVKGFEYAVSNLGADVLIMIDADLSHDPAVIPSFLREIEKEVDLVIGSRYIKGGDNRLSLHRRIFSLCANIIIRFLVRLYRIHEFTTSYRALTVDLYKKINFDKVPWKSKSFVFQSAFVYEAAMVAKRVVEVPIIFSDRRRGRSKMQTFRYIYEVMRYSLSIAWIRYQTLIRFSVVGVTGTIVDFAFYKILINIVNILPYISKLFSTEMGIINNFIWNNTWTFRARKNRTPLWRKFMMYNFFAIGGGVIASIMIYFLTKWFGREHNTIYFLLTIPPQMVWNFSLNHFITWKKTDAKQ